jgi:hypothetical protein
MEGCLFQSPFSIRVKHNLGFSESVLSLPDIGVECDETSKEQSCLVVLKTIAIAKLSTKPILLHPSNPCRFVMGKLMGYMVKYCRKHNLFLICVISSRGKHKTLNCTSDAHFGVCLHVFTNSFDPRCSVRFFH